ncbi:MAG: FAD-dependent oxidoreductase, partial [Chloroflexi bacterium]|nr:FAD-dependent oxidoreductase [Chloroflexota bacterium]
LGVEIRYGVRAGADVTVASLRAEGFAAVLVAVGAQRPKPLGLAGENAAGIVDGVTFLRSVREGRPIPVGPRVAVVGAGDTAMDCARSALRVGATEVSLVYRRTIDQMPADREEIHAIREEGVRIVELARPVGLRVADGRLSAVTCVRTAYGGPRDASGRKVPRDVPGSEHDLAVDTLIVAIGQEADLGVFGSTAPALTPAGFVASDPETLETSIAGVYVAGDVGSHGPASIVRAAADGKRAAAAIAGSLGTAALAAATDQAGTAATVTAVDAPTSLPGDLTPGERRALVARRAHRAYRVPVRTSALDDRGGFAETVLGYTEDEAVREASRCLDCDRMCSLCVGVCPNVALMTYASVPLRAGLPVLALRDGAPVCLGSVPFRVDQGLQVAVLTDLCNECGDCVTACPTAGRPYADKPRLYLDRTDFEAEASNAFMLLGDGAIEARFDGRTHRLDVVTPHTGGRLEYAAPGFRATLDRDSLRLLELEPTEAEDGDLLPLEPAAVMATILAGVTGSLPHIPVAGEGGTRVAAPGH